MKDESQRPEIGLNRRTLLAAIGGTTAVGAGIWISLEVLGSKKGVVEPTRIELLNSQGSRLVPSKGRVSVIDVFATWCAPCKEQMGRVSSIKDEVDASFVSVSNEYVGGNLTRDDIREWWDKHGGDWPVGLDTEGKLTRRLGVTQIPFTAVVDSKNRIAWTHSGVASGEKLVETIQGVE